MSVAEVAEVARLAPSSDAALLLCSAARWGGDETRCRWCDAELPKGRRRWCSNECSIAFTSNHSWSWARGAARRRDHHSCVDCRVTPLEARDRAVAYGLSPSAARRYLHIQVHHKTPVLGRHGVFGCHHHLNGLETVCLHHHLERHAAIDGQLPIEATG